MEHQVRCARSPAPPVRREAVAFTPPLATASVSRLLAVIVPLAVVACAGGRPRPSLCRTGR
jgi:hypothetical protein